MQERLKDVYAAASVLAGRADVKPDKIAAMGFSHGGWTLLNAAARRAPLSSDRERLTSRHGKLAAVIAAYPSCGDTIYEDFVAPILILVGDNDDWTPPLNCRFLAERPPARALPVRLKIYPDARHAFDVDMPPRTLEGHHLEYNPAATEDARRMVVDFLAEALK